MNRIFKVLKKNFPSYFISFKVMKVKRPLLYSHQFCIFLQDQCSEKQQIILNNCCFQVSYYFTRPIFKKAANSFK